MEADLICRYSNAGVTPTQLLYVDCDCCLEGRGQTKLQQRFGGWPDLVVKLDLYHFMRRLASGCTKDAHPLYPIFMAKLSCCIFECDSEDVALVRQAKREQLKREGVPGITEKMVDQHITKDELPKHCRRQTRGEQQTIVLIECLLNELMGEKGRDLLGVPLLDQERMQHIWQTQRRHVKCIQDEPGVLLYAQTGTTTKEGIILPNYRGEKREQWRCAVDETADGEGCELPLDVPKTIRSGLSAVTTGSASVLPLLPTTLTTTVLAAAATAMAGLRVITPAAPEQQRAVDERCVPGMERVDCLAEYLVGLRTETGQTLNNQQASTLIALWQNLLPYDQQRLTYTARHQSIFVKLCSIYKSRKKQGKCALTRWTLILRDYSKIRHLVLANGAVMQGTTLQLLSFSGTISD
ncbi:Hypothetical protein SMAX5B_009660 [Scophthalmus maximus]|uniref:Uncharacterized protein n=1 Tax=Scophthalmus maximus TaxID=52904 RepID=A0A2U9C4P1_SCOMX|nr:Hypothetical protein SMAX5B_009660 [Scophthalmus maximus]